MLLLLRNFIYQFLFKKHGKQYALREYKSIFGVLLGLFYVIFFSVIATIMFKTGVKFWFNTRSLLNQSLMGLLLFIPFYYFLEYIHKKLPELVEEDFIELTSKEKRKVYWFIVVAYLSLISVPWLLDLIIPDNLFK